MTVDAVKEMITLELSRELSITDGKRFNETLLASKVNAAYRDVKAARRYPSSYTDAMIEDDMERFISQIREIALYDYSLIGAEGQTSNSEDGISRHYVDRKSLFAGVMPLSVTG